MSKKIDMIGTRYGNLVVIKEVSPHQSAKEKRTTYLCNCDCGSVNCRKTKETTGKRLRSGITKSCGARENEHTNIDMVKNSTYKIIYRSNYNDGDLSFEDCVKLFNSNCLYCGVFPQNKNNQFKRGNKNLFSFKNGEVIYSGIDRIDSNLPHNLYNCVPCCINCNEFKLSLSYDEFISNIKNLNENFTPYFVKDLNIVKNKIIRYNEIRECENTRAKTILGKLFPSQYKNPRGSFISSKVRGFVSRIKENNVNCELSEIDIAELMLADCIYCGKKTDLLDNKINTIDRYLNFDIDGNKTGYTKDNCVSACMNCNCAKRQLSIDDFRSWMIRIKSNLNNLPESKEKLDEFLNSRVI